MYPYTVAAVSVLAITGTPASAYAQAAGASAVGGSTRHGAPPSNAAPCGASVDPQTTRRLSPAAADRYLDGDVEGALRAWNAHGRPTTSCVRVFGAHHIDPALIAAFTGLTPGAPLTSDRLIRARRRLRQLPLSVGTLVKYAPVDRSSARVDVDLAERDVFPAGLVPAGVVVTSAVATQELTVDAASPTGHGEDVSTAIRWEPNWHRVLLGANLPVAGRLGGVATVGARWERQLYTPAPGIRTTLERRSINIGLSTWSRSWLWWHAAAGGDRMGGATYGSLEAAVDGRLLQDRVALQAEAGAWQGRARSAHFERAVGRLSFRSTTRENAPTWLGSVGLGMATDRAPYQVWVSAGTRTSTDALLRAHPLVRDGAVRGRALGRRLAFGTIE